MLPDRDAQLEVALNAALGDAFTYRGAKEFSGMKPQRALTGALKKELKKELKMELQNELKKPLNEMALTKKLTKGLEKAKGTPTKKAKKARRLLLLKG